MIPWLQGDTPFPPIETALTEADGASGLLAAGADLSPARLLSAYRHGIFPWFSEGQPILWWSTDPRMVLRPENFVVAASLKKKLKQVDRDMARGGRWQVRFNTAFEAVMRACAAPRSVDGGTWITDQIVEGYVDLHRVGHAHSSELWQDGALVAGAYGVSIGRMFYGESMFTKISDGSKIALAYLVHFLNFHGVEMIDCQQETRHLRSLGAAPISRSEFLALMNRAISEPEIPVWRPMPLF